MASLIVAYVMPVPTVSVFAPAAADQSATTIESGQVSAHVFSLILDTPPVRTGVPQTASVVKNDAFALAMTLATERRRI
jgi:hypothetical protein